MGKARFGADGVVVVVVGGAVVVVVTGGVVVVVGGAVVVVVEGAVVVVVEGAVPPPPPPPDAELPVAPPPELAVATGVGVAGAVVGEIEEIVDQRFTSPENWLLFVSEARVRTTAERTELESRPPNADADASMLTIAIRVPDATSSVTIFGMRCVVFARKKFLSERLYMEYKFAVSNHTSADCTSTVPQIKLRVAQVSTASHQTVKRGPIIAYENCVKSC
jgi:hypothetical protein